MKKHSYVWLGMLIFAAALLCFSSCVNEEYDVAEMDTEITLGGESLTLPLGSTKQLKLKNLMAGMSEDMLQVLDGGYAFRINDKLDLGEQLPDMKDMLVIPDVVFEEKTTYNLSGFEDESMSIDAQEFSYSFELADDELDLDVDTPKIAENNSNPTGIWEKGKSARDMEIELNDVQLTTQALFEAPRVSVSEGKVNVPDFPETPVEPETATISVTSQAPDGISNISDVMMADNAVMEIKLTAVNSFLSSGDVIPNMVLNLNGLAVLEKGMEQIAINEDFTLSAANGYAVTKNFKVVELVVESSDWDAAGRLNLNKDVEMKGSAVLKNVVVDAAELAGYTADGMGLHVEISFKDMNIKSIMMDVELDPVVETMTIPVTIDELELPDGVTGVNKVAFTEASILDMSIATKNLNIPGLDLQLQSIKAVFPESMNVLEAVDGVWEVTGVNLDKAFERQLHVSEFYLPAAVEGKISYSENVELEAVMTLGGRICSADVPYTEETDGVFMVNAESEFEIDDYYAQIDGVTHDLDLEPREFSYSLPADIADIGTFTIFPEGEPALVVDFEFPKTDPKIQAGKDGLVIKLPEFLKFKQTGYEFDHETNTLYIKGDVPEQIQLPIEKLVVTPEKDDETGGFMANGQIIIEGLFEVAPGEVSGSTIELLVESEACIIANIPVIVASEISFDKFEIESAEQFEFTILKGDDLPEQVKSVSEVLLDDVNVQIDIEVADMPDFGVDPLVEFTLELPEALVLDEADPRVKGNMVSVSGAIKNNKVDIKPIAVKAIDLSDYDLSSGKDIVATMSVNGLISVAEPNVALKDLGGDMIMNIRAAIEDIDIEQVSASVDYKIDGINQAFKLEGLPEFMKGDGFVIDLANPHLVLKTTTNMGIPVSGTLAIVPIIGGVENKEARIDATINLPYTDSPDKTESMALWFGADKESCPADYTFVEADINKLIRRLPDELRISLVAGTDSNKECVLNPSAEYDLEMEYDFVVPLAFGKDLHIELCDTIYLAAPIVGHILEKNKVQLAGSIKSSLPVQLELNIELLDDEYKPIPMEQSATQRISAGNSDGTAAESPLDLLLALDKNASASGLAGVKLTFEVSAPNSTGRPVGEEDFVQADLKITVPEGITLDIEGLM